MIKRGILLLSALMIVFSLSGSRAYARDIKTVEGLIENVTDDSIKVRGGYYHFTDVPLRDPSGKNMPKNQLKIGRKVEIFIHNRNIDAILIYPEHMLE